MSDSTVWVVQDNNYPIRTASKYGILRFITQHDLSIVSGSRSELLVSNDIREFIKEYKPDVDYILLVGNPIVIGMVFGAIGKYLSGNEGHVQYHDKHRILKWDARDKIYYDYIVDLRLI